MSGELRWLSTFVRQRSAIVLPAEKAYLFKNRLTPLANQEGLHSLDELARVLRRAPDSTLAEQVVEAMTTNETSFFRDVHPWKHLEYLLRGLRGRECVRIWCGAASAGQEPWTIAMVARESLGSTPFELWATDLSRAMIARCERGVYSGLEVRRGLDGSRLARWFEPRGHQWRVKDELRHGVRFGVQNLTQPLAHTGPFDVVLLRNVLFYFDVATRRRVLSEVRRTLAPGGQLFLGASEATLHRDEGFARTRYGKSVSFSLRTS